MANHENQTGERGPRMGNISKLIPWSNDHFVNDVLQGASHIQSDEIGLKVKREIYDKVPEQEGVVSGVNSFWNFWTAGYLGRRAKEDLEDAKQRSATAKNEMTAGTVGKIKGDRTRNKILATAAVIFGLNYGTDYLTGFSPLGFLTSKVIMPITKPIRLGLANALFTDSAAGYYAEGQWPPQSAIDQDQGFQLPFFHPPNFTELTFGAKPLTNYYDKVNALPGPENSKYICMWTVQGDDEIFSIRFWQVKGDYIKEKITFYGDGGAGDNLISRTYEPKYYKDYEVNASCGENVQFTDLRNKPETNLPQPQIPATYAQAPTIKLVPYQINGEPIVERVQSRQDSRNLQAQVGISYVNGAEPTYNILFPNNSNGSFVVREEGQNITVRGWLQTPNSIQIREAFINGVQNGVQCILQYNNGTYSLIGSIDKNQYDNKVTFFLIDGSTMSFNTN